ncbi:MAG: DUF2138 family protein [Pseudomonadota bacterium]|nr:DUF2138 family protein [Pseudomonadota bacterium]
MTRPASHSRLPLTLVAAIIITLSGLAVGISWRSRQRIHPPRPMPARVQDVAPVKLARPDALIVSTSLRDLPRDLLKVPLLRVVLTEDFVFYYQQNSHLLGIEGTLRRIAYEHGLSLRDDAIALLLDRPADIALWRGRDGRLSHWMIDTDGHAWLPLLKIAASLVGSDPAIREVGTLPLPGGKTTPLYKLEYGLGRSVFFAGANGHLVLFSDPAMVDGKGYGDAPDRARFWQALLTSGRADSPLRSHFGLQNFSGKHALVVDADALSFNYQHYAPDIEALRFDFDGLHWASYLRLAPGRAADFNTAGLWQALPDDPGLCVGAPLDFKRLRPTLQSLQHDNARVDPALASALGNPAAVCWFASGSIYTPLILVPIADGARWDDAVGALFKDSVGNSWPRYRNADASGAAASDTPDSAAAPSGDRVWTDTVPTDYGSYTMMLTRARGWLVFSPDAKAVRDTVAAIGRRRPTLADPLSKDDGRVVAVITPSTLSQLLRRAIDGDLPEDKQPLFHKAAAERLLPRLDALGKFPPYVLSLPTTLDTTHRYWQPITWHILPAVH